MVGGHCDWIVYSAQDIGFDIKSVKILKDRALVVEIYPAGFLYWPNVLQGQVLRVSRSCKLLTGFYITSRDKAAKRQQSQYSNSSF